MHIAKLSVSPCIKMQSEIIPAIILDILRDDFAWAMSIGASLFKSCASVCAILDWNSAVDLESEFNWACLI